LLVVVIYSFQKVVKTMTFYIWCFSPARDDDDDDDEVVVVIVGAFVILSGGASTMLRSFVLGFHCCLGHHEIRFLFGAIMLRSWLWWSPCFGGDRSFGYGWDDDESM